jgi:prevent-host-death family protein
MKHVPVATFKDRVSEFVSEAERGEEVIITRHGKPAARLSAIAPDEDAQRVQRRAAINGLRALRQRLYDQGVRVSVEEMIEWKNEGRR